MPTFILNDETKVNCYGFRVLNSSIELSRFKDNPVMLVDHMNSVATVIGKWKNIRVEGSQLLADTEFDQGDEEAKKIEGKVERGYIKGCSMGLLRPEFKRGVDGVPETISTELMEGTICGIPANAGALKLYSAPGAVMEEAQIKLSLLTVTTEQPFNNPTMSQIKLSALALVALGFAHDPTENDGAKLSSAIEAMNAELDSKTIEIAELKTKLKDQAKLQSKTLIDDAILSGKITEADRTDCEEMPLGVLSKMLGKLQGKSGLAAQVNNPSGNAADPKTADDFEKMPLAAQLAFKTANPDAYKKLFA
jgi:hypothetical protein